MKVTEVDITKLKDHPENYREHSDDQLLHIIESIEKNDFYKNIVVAKDYTVLAGHGVFKAAVKMGKKTIPVHILDIESDSVDALKILTGDNEIGRLAGVNDRELTEILKRVKEQDKLLGTGFDEMILANLLVVTRPASEIKDLNAAAEWVGMPDYQDKESSINNIIYFASLEDQKEFFEKIGQEIPKNRYFWYPKQEQSDTKSVKFE